MKPVSLVDSQAVRLEGRGRSGWLRLFAVSVQLRFQVEVPETQVDWVLSGVGPGLHLITASTGCLCIEPNIFRYIDLAALSPTAVRSLLEASARSMGDRNKLRSIGLPTANCAARRSSVFRRYVVWQWAEVGDAGSMPVDALSSLLRGALALALRSHLRTEVAVSVQDPKGFFETVLSGGDHD